MIETEEQLWMSLKRRNLKPITEQGSKKTLSEIVHYENYGNTGRA
jgi:hypothetical protein